MFTSFVQSPVGVFVAEMTYYWSYKNKLLQPTELHTGTSKYMSSCYTIDTILMHSGDTRHIFEMPVSNSTDVCPGKCDIGSGAGGRCGRSCPYNFWDPHSGLSPTLSSVSREAGELRRCPYVCHDGRCVDYERQCMRWLCGVNWRCSGRAGPACHQHIVRDLLVSGHGWCSGTPTTTTVHVM